jgi:hypothetical protein
MPNSLLRLIKHLGLWCILPGLRFRWAKPATISSLNDVPEQLSLFPRNAVVDVDLSQDIVLRKTTKFPRVAEKELEAVVALFVKKSFPQAEKLYVWRHVVTARTKQDIAVKILILKKTHLEAVTTSAAVKNLRLRKISCQDEAGAVSFLPRDASLDRPIFRWSAFAAILVIFGGAMLGWAEWQAHSNLQRQITELEDQKLQITQQAISAKESQSNADDAIALIQADIKKMSDGSRALSDLTTISAILSDNVWITEFRQSGPKTEITGFSTSAVNSAIEDLQRGAAFQEVTLIAPISTDRLLGASRFQLKLLRNQ